VFTELLPNNGSVCHSISLNQNYDLRGGLGILKIKENTRIFKNKTRRLTLWT
jgi:hypothetical protein